MSRVYMIYIHPVGSNGNWQFFRGRHDTFARMYQFPPSPASIKNAITSWLGGDRGQDHDHRVVYFDTDDLLDLTDDAELAYQQAEARVLRAGEVAEDARSAAANPVPAPVEATVAKKKRKSRNKATPCPGSIHNFIYRCIHCHCMNESPNNCTQCGTNVCSDDGPRECSFTCPA